MANNEEMCEEEKKWRRLLKKREENSLSAKEQTEMQGFQIVIRANEFVKEIVGMVDQETGCKIYGSAADFFGDLEDIFTGKYKSE